MLAGGMGDILLFQGLPGLWFSAVHRALFPSQYGGGGVAVSQRARVQRGPSEAARCASTGNRQADHTIILKGINLEMCDWYFS